MTVTLGSRPVGDGWVPPSLPAAAWEGRVSALMGQGKDIRDPGAAACPYSCLPGAPGAVLANAGNIHFPAASWVLLSYLCLFSGDLGTISGDLGCADSKDPLWQDPDPVRR